MAFRHFPILLCFVFLAGLASAAEIDVAYILEDASTVDPLILDILDDSSLSYEIVRDSHISTTNFSRYNILVVIERVTNSDLLPFNSVNSIFLDRSVAEEVWPDARTGSISRSRSIIAGNSNSFVFDDVPVPTTNNVVVYDFVLGNEVHYLNPRYPRNITILANVLSQGNLRPVVAYTETELQDRTVKKLFFGLKVYSDWNGNAAQMFANSLNWMMLETDRDGDGWPISLDCDDNDAGSNPEADEIPYDAIDQDCDGFDITDLDQDGFDADCDFVDGVCFIDGGLDCDDQDFTINPENDDLTLNCINDAPFVEPLPSFSAQENSLVTIEIHATDPENDDLEYFVDNDQIVGDGNVFEWLIDYSSQGTHVLTFTVSDGENEVETTATVIVSDINQPPSLLGEIPEIVFDEDTIFTFNLAQYFEDGDGDDLIYGAVVDEDQITVNVYNNGTVVLIPQENFYGEVSVAFFAFDNFTQTFSNEIQIFVENVNDPISFVGSLQNFSWNEDTELRNAINLNNYFRDIDSTLHFEVFGNLNIDVEIENGFVSFNPEENFAGTEQIYFEATDGEFVLQSDVIYLEVIPVGDLPVFESLDCDMTIDEDSQNECDILTLDIEGNEVSLAISGQDKMDCVLNGNSLSYSPFSDYFGIARCTIAATNIYGTSFKEFTVNVLSVNDAPTIDSYSPNQVFVVVPENRNRLFSVDARDVDSSSFSIRWFLDGEQVQFGSSAQNSFSFNRGEGEYSLEVLVSDSEFNVTQQWDVFVGPTNGFTCSEVVGTVCSEDEICRGGLVDVSDSGACCSTSCEPGFKNANSCDLLDENVSIEIRKPERDKELELSDSLRIELRVSNDYDEDTTFDIFAHLYNLDRKKSEESVDEELEVAAGRSRIYSFDLGTDEDLDLNQRYAIFVRASDGDNVCNQNYTLIDFERMDENVRIEKFDIPSQVSCGEIIEARVRVENFGSEEQEVNFSLTNRKLGIEEYSSFVLGEFGDEDYKNTQKLLAEIPESAEGSYELAAVINYGSHKRQTVTESFLVACERDELSGSIATEKNSLSEIKLNRLSGFSEVDGSLSKQRILGAFSLLFLNVLLAISFLLFVVAYRKNKRN